VVRWSGVNSHGVWYRRFSLKFVYMLQLRLNSG